MSHIQLGDKQYAVQHALEFLLGSTIHYMQAVTHEMLLSEPDPFKTYQYVNLANDNARALEGLIMTAMDQKVRILEGDLESVKNLHCNIHALQTDVDHLLFSTLTKWIAGGKPREEVRRLARIAGVPDYRLDQLIANTNMDLRPKILSKKDKELN